MKIGKYELKYQPKVDRAIKAVGDKDENAILVEYDRLGGLIVLNGEKVKSGSFYDVKNGTAFDRPQVVVIKKARAAREEVVSEQESEEEVPRKKKKKSSK